MAIAVEDTNIQDPKKTPKEKEDATSKAAKLHEAKAGWQGLLDRNTKLYDDAKSGKLNDELVTHLVADALLQSDGGVDNVKYIDGDDAPNAEPLRNISAIRYQYACEFSDAFRC